MDRNRMVADAKAAVKLLLQRTKKRENGPIRVGFMCQYIPAWNKAEPIYEAMVKDARFEPVVICVPSGISRHELIDPESTENDTYRYYVEHGYEAVNALIGKNEWLDLTTLNLDYLFFLRPYDFYMPLQYNSSTLAKSIKLCVILYGITVVKEDMNIMLEPDFFRNVFCYFAECEDSACTNRKNFPLSHALGLRKSVHYGIPALHQIMQERDKESDAWDFSSGTFRILWTPRWTTDLALGGTNFFTYKDWILQYAEENPDVTCLLRPHPLAFDNFVKAGDMTQEEVDAYLARCESLPNTEIDKRKEYVTSMWHSDVLIGDISGILPEYFIMNKPLIFCKSNMILEPTGFAARMFEGCYIVNNVEELEACLAQLRRGEDPLKAEREQIIQELFGDRLYTAVASILNELA